MSEERMAVESYHQGITILCPVDPDASDERRHLSSICSFEDISKEVDWTNLLKLLQRGRPSQGMTGT